VAIPPQHPVRKMKAYFLQATGNDAGSVGQAKAWKMWTRRLFSSGIRVNRVKSGIRNSPEGLHL
jgi:hypothetical protein